MRSLDDITDAVLAYHPEADVDIILDAYFFSAKAHRGQSRQSGEAYLVASGGGGVQPDTFEDG